MKRKLLSLALALVMVIGLLPTAAFAMDSDFVIVNGVITKYQGPGGDVVIPDNIATKIGPRSFWISGVTSVAIGDGITTISDGAFSSCRQLTSVTLPEGLTSIGREAFELCDKLTSITLPSTLTTIGVAAFDSSGLSSVAIPYNVNEVSFKAFFSCSNLENVVFSNPDVLIGSRAFDHTPWLESQGDFVILKNTLLKYQGSAAQVTIPNGITRISSSAFGGRDTLGTNTTVNKVTIPDGVIEIGSDAFADCYNLTEIIIPNSVTQIEGAAFEHCHSLANIKIPRNVTQIGDWAFSDTGISSMELPSGISAIGENTFYNCKNLTNITIPDGVETIERGAFHGCEKLTSAVIPSSVTSIKGSAFENCDALTIYGVLGSEAERYAKKGYESTVGFGGTLSSKYYPIPFVAVDKFDIPGAVSPWARAEIETADKLGLIMPSCEIAMTRSITREQFAELAVNLVETITGSALETAPWDTFSDCWNLDVLRAYAAGIVNGVGDGRFAPDDGLTREQLASMLYRAWALVDAPAPVAGLDGYTDAGDVASWAVESVDSLAAAGIMKGTSDTALSPQAPCTVEQAILLVYRLYQKVKG